MSATTAPICPKCGTVMCERFDLHGPTMVPNGTYTCYLCNPKVIGIENEDERQSWLQQRPLFCGQCGADLPGPRATAQTKAVKRFDHRHDCPQSPSYQFRRRLGILSVAAALYPYEQQLAGDSDDGIQNAVGIAEEIWREIERRDRAV